MNNSLPAKILEVFGRVIGPSPVALHEPSFIGSEWQYLKDCLDSSYVSSVGHYVDRFERDLEQYTGSKHAIAVMNGTAALHMALLLAGVKPGSEVLMPSLTFVATANSVLYAGANPHFVDSNSSNLGIDADALEDYLSHIVEKRAGLSINKQTMRPISGLIVMHTFGHIGQIDALQRIAHDYSFPLIEDAAESLGSFYNGQHSGTFGLLGTLSFNGNKTITTGGGGAILTQDDCLARLAKHLTTTAKMQHPWAYEHDQMGFNYRLPNLNAAIGCAQLESLPQLLAEKRSLTQAYQLELSAVNGVQLLTEPSNTRSNYWLQTLVLDQANEIYRDKILQITNEAGYMTRPVWNLMHRLSYLKTCPKMPLVGAESLERRLINIPSSSVLGRG